MKNIFFYVHRTGLLSYFVNPMCSVLSKDFKITILHLDKKNGYSYAANMSPLYNTIDLSSKSIGEIEMLFKELKPIAFVSLGFISIFELLMLRIAKKMGVKTIFLEHGLYSKETASLPFRKLIHKFGYTVSKNLYFLRRYIEFAWTSGAFKKEIFVFWHCFRKKEYYITKFDKALFFAEYGRKMIGSLFHYKDNEVEYIGYPLAKTNAEYEKYKDISRIPLTEEKKATFIHQPFILDGLVQWSYEEERDYFVQISDMLKGFGYSLSIQLHPRSDINTYLRLFKDTDIQVQQNMERSDFKKFSLVVGHYSTALLYPIFFKIPVMLVDYPGVCKAVDSVFYPVSCTLPIKDIDSLTDRYKVFCDEYIGKGICSFENIARKLKETIVKGINE